MSKVVQLKINPEVLRWAREESGYTIDEVVERLKINRDRYETWETTGSGIPLGKLTSLAVAFKRQLAAFFLPEPPAKVKKPSDYRNVGIGSFSKKLLLAIRNTNYFRALMSETEGEERWKRRYAALPTLHNQDATDDSMYEQLRVFLGVSVEQQMQWKGTDVAYRHWRRAFEEQLGILVFQFSIPPKEAAGFSFSDGAPFSITTNSKYTYSGRIFTLFHELGHILRRHSGLCLLNQTGTRFAEERACDRFAAEFLVPGHLVESATTVDEVAKLASRFNVSREVYLRRLYELNYLPESLFDSLLREIRASYTNVKTKSGPVAPEVMSRATRGETFYKTILSAVGDRRISFSTASGALGLSVPRILSEL